MKTKNILFNSLIVFFSIYFPLLIYSLFFSLWSTRLKLTSIKIKNINLQDTKIKKIEAIRSGFLPIYPPNLSKQYAKDYSIFPIGSLPNTKSFYCDEGLGLVKYKTDRFGLRNNDQNWREFYKEPKIFVVGDSFVHGACVDDKSTIPANINYFSGVQTVNLGSGENGPYEYMALMKSIVNPIIKNEDGKNWVVLVFYYNDNVRNKLNSQKLLSETKSIVNLKSNGHIEPKNEYKKNLKKLVNNNFPVKKIELINGIKNQTPENLFNLNANLTLQPVLWKINEIVKNYNSKSDLQNPSNQSLNLLADICSNKCKPIVVYIPYSSFWYPAPKSLDIKYKNQLRKHAIKLNIPFVDGTKVIDRNNLHDYSPKGGHLSPKGNRKLGNLITKEIKKNSSIKNILSNKS